MWAQGTMFKSLGFVGGGQMAEAIIAGIVKKGVLTEEKIFVSEPVEGRRAYLKGKWPKMNVGENNAEVCRESNVVVLAVKPQMLDSALSTIQDDTAANGADKVFISILAGTPLLKLEAFLVGSVVRVMPNMPAMVGEGAAGFALGARAKESPVATEWTRVVMGAFCGVCEEVPEKMMDAVTGLSGSGPAYVFIMIEALADGGVQQGLPRDLALKLASQTVLGAAKTVLESDKHVAALKDSVCSPGGTTIAGVAALESGGFRAAAMQAVGAATARSKELGKL
jgi:pyrroline-5-carboxylate reductase